MLKINKKALVIGETNLCIKCSEYLLEHKWNIISVVSDDPKVINWAITKSIPSFSVSKLDEVEEFNFYLFSIINLYLIPESFLIDKKVKLAINYHDSFLPKYGGLNSTSWAIFNGETQHGISLHRITSGIDEGDLVIQTKIAINKNETALSLNLKCSEALLKVFPKLIKQIEDNNLAFTKQKLQNKTYYGAKAIPDNFAIINGIKDYSIIDHLDRGLTFNDNNHRYKNSITTPKVFLNGQFYIVENFNQKLLRINKITPSYHNKSNKNNINTVVFNTIRNIFGAKLDIEITAKDIAKKCSLTARELKYLSTIKYHEARDVNCILKHFEHVNVSLTVLDFISHKTPKSSNYIETVTFPASENDISKLTALIYIVLARFFNDKFITTIYTDDIKIPTKKLRSLVEYKGFMYINPETLKLGFKALNWFCDTTLCDTRPLMKDLAYRYNMEVLTDIAIVAGKVDLIDNHQLLISIVNGIVELKGNPVHKLQIASIAECLSVLFAKYMQKDFYEQDLDTISLLSDVDYKKIVYDFNKTEAKFPENKTVHQLFEEQVRLTPNSIAIANGSVQLSYETLNEKANQLARYLRSTYKINGDDLIAFCLDRSEHVICVLIAILKASGAYVPIDPTYPDGRITYILQNTKTKLIISEEAYSSRLNKLLELTPPITNISLESINDLQTKHKIKNQPKNNLVKNITSSNLAYVIFTSGTTGKPKGVMVEHKSVVNYLSNIKDKIFKQKTKNVDFSTNIGFDLTVTAILGSLCCGYRICVYPGDVKDLNRYKAHLVNNKINIIKLSPSYFELLLDILSGMYIDTVILGGEKVPISILNKTFKPDLTIYDEYGPTEATVGTCLSKIYAHGSASDYLNIGNAYSNYKTYVLDNRLNVLPIGAIGELYIGGAGLARGYLNQPELTKQKFVHNPFQNAMENSLNKNNMLYKTGDLVRYLPNGNIEYIGRTDLQVKLRGYRIELAEIEAAIDAYPGIKQSIVNVVELITNSNAPVNKCLIGYYVADYKLNEMALLDHLAAQLPEYMVPITLTYIDNIPLTINGKLDRDALPNPKLSLQNEYIAPANNIERKICMAYSEILNLPIEDIGVNHDFFNLGGNSILAIHLTFKLQHKFQISVNDIFKFRTPAKIAQSVKLKKPDLLNRIKQIKLIYNKQAHIEKDNKDFNKKHQQYLQEIHQIKINKQVKKINTVLLTGATGHLGNHILYQLLFETSYKIYLLVRSTSNADAYVRVSNKFKFYFNIDLAQYLDRIIVLAADIEKPNLNLSIMQYQELITNIDSIIHAAASVKHYGDYNSFYHSNTMATVNLLELAKLTTLKDFHYISTLSVLTNGYIPNNNYYVFTEDDNNINLVNNTNIYSYTKYEGELAVINYRQYGINSNIYRVGNLSMNSQTYRNQENINENAFFITIKTLLNMGMIPKEMSKVEISPVDYTALAIVKLFDNISTNNQTFHVANTYMADLLELFGNNSNIDVKITTLNNFLNTMLTKLNDDSINKQIELFMLHQGWLEEIDINNLTKFVILKNKTDYILSNLGFNWIPITEVMLSDIVNQATTNTIEDI